jgi:hypothetical protein
VMNTIFPRKLIGLIVKKRDGRGRDGGYGSR